MAPEKVIIETDPGVDDINAILLALAASPVELEILLISVTYGNVDVASCLRNAISLFYVIEKEREWRRSQGLLPGFESLDQYKPIVAAGASGPLEEQLRMADYGIDGLGGIHKTHAHLFPSEPWEHLFDIPPPDTGIMATSSKATGTLPSHSTLFVPSKRPSHLEILDLLSANPPNTVTIISLGPMTNLALAASVNPQILARAKEIVAMGGALKQAGNVSPVAEFNIFADSIAAARVFALTSPIPLSTMPPVPPSFARPAASTPSSQPMFLPPYPPLSELGPARLSIVLFPLDVTEKHMLNRSYYLQRINHRLESGSPLAEWHFAFMAAVFNKMERLHVGHSGTSTSVALHDPLCVWWALNARRKRVLEDIDYQKGSLNGKGWQLSHPVDLRIETTGQWCRGQCIVDGRDRRKQAESRQEAEKLDEREGDVGGWLSNLRGNKISVVVDTPGGSKFADFLLDTIFDLKAS